MNHTERFARLIRDELGGELLRVKGGYCPPAWLKGDLVFIVVKQKEITIREKIFRLLSEISGVKGTSLCPLIYSSFEVMENRSMRSSFVSWLEREGFEY